jgi:2-(3-amino-3-carboxypropyl)histidine synthase
MVDTIFIKAEYNGEVELTNEIISKCREYKEIGIYSSVQFIDKLDSIIKKLENLNIKVISSKPERANEKFQILGCDVFNENLKLKKMPDAFLYVGDGKFHPTALMFAQKDNIDFKPIITYNPISKNVNVINEYDFRKYKASMMKFLNAKNIGVFISTKIGQQQYKQSKKLEIKYPSNSGKKFYYFIADNFNQNELDNFSFVDVWINTACPRIAFDDIHSMINLNDALKANEILSKDSLLTR